MKRPMSDHPPQVANLTELRQRLRDDFTHAVHLLAARAATLETIMPRIEDASATSADGARCFRLMRLIRGSVRKVDAAMYTLTQYYTDPATAAAITQGEEEQDEG